MGSKGAQSSKTRRGACKLLGRIWIDAGGWARDDADLISR